MHLTPKAYPKRAARTAANSAFLSALCLTVLFFSSIPAHAQRFVKVVNTVDELVRLNPNDVNTNVFVADPNRGGLFTLAPRGTTNSGTLFASTNATRQWNRQFTGPVQATWFGVIPNDGVNHLATFQAALDTGLDVFVAAGTNFIGGELQPRSNQKISGAKGAVLKRWPASGHQTVFNVGGLSNVVVEGFHYDYNAAPGFHRFVADANLTSTNITVQFNFVYDSVQGQTPYTPGTGDRWFAVGRGVAHNWRLIGNVIKGPIQLAASWQSGSYGKLLNNYIENGYANAISIVNGGNAAGANPAILGPFEIAGNVIINPGAIGIVFGPDFTAGVTNLVYVDVDIHNNYITMGDIGFGIYGRTPKRGVDGLKIRNNTVRMSGTSTGRPIRLENDIGFTNDEAYFRSPVVEGNTWVGGNVGAEFQNVTGMLYANNIHQTNATGFRTLGKVEDTLVTGGSFDVIGHAILHEYAGDIRIVNVDFLKWGAASSFFRAITLNPTSVGDGNFTTWIYMNRFKDLGVAETAIGRLLVAGATNSLKVVVNDFADITTVLEDNATSQAKVWFGNVPMTTANQSVDQISGANIPNDTITPAHINVSALIGSLTNTYSILNWTAVGIISSTELSALDGLLTNLVTHLQLKQDAFTTGPTLTNIGGVLDAKYVPGTNVVFVTNSTSVSINVGTNGAAVTDTDGYIELPTVTTTDSTATPIFTNTPAINTVTIIHADIYAIENGAGNAMVRSVNILFLDDGGSLSAVMSDPTANQANLGTEAPTYDVTASIVGGTTGKVFVDNNGAVADVKWKMRYRIQTHSF